MNIVDLFPSFLLPWKKEKANICSILLFTEQLLAVTEENLPLVPSLRMIASDTKEVNFRRLIQAVARDMEEGHSLYESLSRRRGAFPQLYLKMVDIGERNGNLSQMLRHLLDHLHPHNLRSTHLTISTMQRDIREANEVVASKEDFVTGKETLILRNEIKGNYTIYHFDREARKLERVVILEEETPYNRAIGVNLQEVRFGYDRQPPSDSRVINVELILKEGALKKERVASFPFSVALRGQR